MTTGITIRLRCGATSDLTPRAAYIRGQGPADWLPVLAHFGEDVDKLELCLLPASPADLRPAGVLVVPPADLPSLPPDSRLHLYGCLASRLFVPLDSHLDPLLPEAALRDHLLWYRQVFHPVLGLVGFEEEDIITVAHLLQAPRQLVSDWRFAAPGQPPPPRLREVRMAAPSLDEMMQDARHEIGTQDLDHIPPAPGEPHHLTDNVRHMERGVVRGLRQLTDKLRELLHSRLSQSAAGPHPHPGLLDRAQHWLDQRLDQLGDIRNQEVSRLLGMLDRDPDEALKYAIPLSGPYASRGQATPSPYLSAKPVTFDLSRLGGGGAVDPWSINDKAYYQLRDKYLKAANRELAKGEHQRAAYIFAYLLGDYHSAANALQQGGFYREAAVLYRDHLKRPLAAAECLERGGLYSAAIDIYVAHDQYEKAGDLYGELERPDKAIACYQHAVAQHVGERGDYLRAAAIEEHKLKDPAAALSTLRTGWPQSGQAVKCLQSYFHLQGRLGLHRESTRDLQEFAEAPMSLQEVQALVTVCADLHQRYPHRPLRERSADQATTLIGHHVMGLDDPEQARRLLNKLAHFAPEDRLLTRDCMRFVTHIEQQPPTPTTPQPESGIVRAPTSSFRLLEVVECFDAQPCRNGYVAMGRAGRDLLVIRGDWQRSHSIRWRLSTNGTDRLRLVADDRVARWALVLAGARHRLRFKSLPPTQTFPFPLGIGTPDWLPDNALAAASGENDYFLVLHADRAGLLLSTYSSAGELVGERVLELEDNLPLGPPHLQVRRGDAYLCLGQTLWRIGAEEVDSLELPGNALLCRASALFSTVRIAVATDNGCLITWPDTKGIDTMHERFARDLNVTAMAFLPGGHLVVAGESEARVYSTRQRQLRYECDVHVENLVVGVVPLGTGNDFALFTKDGNVSLYRLT